MGRGRSQRLSLGGHERHPRDRERERERERERQRERQRERERERLKFSLGRVLKRTLGVQYVSRELLQVPAIPKDSAGN